MGEGKWNGLRESKHVVLGWNWNLKKILYTHTHTHTQKTDNHNNKSIHYVYIFVIYKINNMNLIMEKSPPQKYQQPISRDLYRWNGNKRAKGKRG